MANFIERFKEKRDSFGMEVAINSSVAALYPYTKHKNVLSWTLLQNKHKAIIKYLEKKYGYVIERHVKEHKCNKKCSQNVIWTMWWQGEEEIPQTVRMCFESIKIHSSNCDFIIVTKDNISEYIRVPAYIEQKVNKGIISFTHFSDIVRMNLLKEYGGLWLDSSIFVTDDIPQEIFTKSYYTVKFAPMKISCVSQGRWVVGIQAAQKENPFMEYMVDFYNEYWKNENSVIEHWLFDYAILIAYRNFDYFRDMLDSLPESDQAIFYFANVMDSPWNEELWKKFKRDNLFFILTRKRQYHSKIDEVDTFYGHFMEELLN